MILVHIEPIPNLNDLAISTSQNRVLERGKRVANPVSDHAVEEAVHMRGRLETEADGLVIGTEEDVDICRRALAMGLDRVYLFNHPRSREFDGLVKAHVVNQVARTTKAEWILFGAGTPDGIGAEVAFRVSEALQIPVVTLSERKEGLRPPCVLRVRSFVNKPRLPSAVEIVKAAKKEITRLSSTILGLTDKDLQPRRVIVSVSLA